MTDITVAHNPGAWRNPRTGQALSANYQRRLIANGVGRDQYERGILRGSLGAARGHRDEQARVVNPLTGKPASYAAVKRTAKRRGVPAPARETLTAAPPRERTPRRGSDAWWIGAAKQGGIADPHLARYFDTYPEAMRVMVARMYVVFNDPSLYPNEWKTLTDPRGKNLLTTGQDRRTRQGYLYGLVQDYIGIMRRPYDPTRNPDMPFEMDSTDLSTDYTLYIYAYRAA